VGRRLREARIAAGLSQRDLAFGDCTAAYISRIEAGARVPSLQLLHELARRLGVSADYLAKGGASDDIDAVLADAELATRLGELERAAELYSEVLARDPAPAQVRAAMMGHAEHALQRGDHVRVVELLEPIAEGLPTSDPDVDTWAADRLGRAYAHLGEYEKSLAILERGFASTRERGDDAGSLRLATLLANAYLDGGSVARAEEMLAIALNLAEKARSPLDQARLWWSQSRLHVREGRPDIAARHARRALDLLDATEHSAFAAAAFQLLAHIENDRGNGADALTLLEQGLPAVRASGNAYTEALFELERARALALIGEHEEAASLAMAIAGKLAQIDPSDVSRSYGLLADIFRSLGEPERACELYELAADRLGEDDPHRGDILTRLGELLEEAGRTSEAMAAYKEAAQLRARTPTR